MKADGELIKFVTKHCFDTEIENLDTWTINDPTIGGPLMHHLGILRYPSRVKFLLSKGADINMPGDLGWTAVYYAAAFGYYKTLALLLSNGANPMIENIFGENVFDFLHRYKNGTTGMDGE